MKIKKKYFMIAKTKITYCLRIKKIVISNFMKIKDKHFFL